MVPYVGSHDVPRLTSRADGGTGDAYNQWQEQGLPGQPGNDDAYQASLQAYGWLLTIQELHCYTMEMNMENMVVRPR